MTRRVQAACLTTTVLACLWLGLFPLLSGGTYAHITHDKWVIALVLGGGSTAAGLASRILRQRSDLCNPVRWLGAAFFLWMGATAFLGSQAGLKNAAGELIVWIGAGRYEGMATQLCYFAVFLALSAMPPRARETGLFAALGLLFFTAVVTLQYLDVNALGLYPMGRSIHTNYEFQGTIGNIDMGSGYVMIVAPLLLGSFLTCKTRWSPLLLAGWLAGVLLELAMQVQGGVLAMSLVSLAAVGLMLAQPQTRRHGLIALGGALLCVAFRLMLCLPWLDVGDALALVPNVRCLIPAVPGVLLILLGVLHRKPGRALRCRTAVCIVLAILLAAIVLTAVLPIPSTAGGLYEAHELLNGRPDDAYGSWRIGVWRHTLHLAGENPIFGLGPDAFYPTLGTHLTAEKATLGENFDNPHNMYLAILVNNGIPGLLLFLALLIGAFVRALRRGDDLGCMLSLSILGYAAQGFFSFSICLVTPMFWAVLGAAAAPARERIDRL